MRTCYILSAELSISGSEGVLAQQYVVAPIMFVRVARVMERNQNFQRSISWLGEHTLLMYNKILIGICSSPTIRTTYSERIHTILQHPSTDPQ